MSPEQEAVINRLIRIQQREKIRAEVRHLISLLSCMKEYRITLPTWVREMKRN